MTGPLYRRYQPPYSGIYGTRIGSVRTQWFVPTGHRVIHAHSYTAIHVVGQHDPTLQLALSHAIFSDLRIDSKAPGVDSAGSTGLDVSSPPISLPVAPVGLPGHSRGPLRQGGNWDRLARLPTAILRHCLPVVQPSEARVDRQQVVSGRLPDTTRSLRPCGRVRLPEPSRGEPLFFLPPAR